MRRALTPKSAVASRERERTSTTLPARRGARAPRSRRRSGRRRDARALRGRRRRRDRSAGARPSPRARSRWRALRARSSASAGGSGEPDRRDVGVRGALLRRRAGQVGEVAARVRGVRERGDEGGRVGGVRRDVVDARQAAARRGVHAGDAASTTALASRSRATRDGGRCGRERRPVRAKARSATSTPSAASSAPSEEELVAGGGRTTPKCASAGPSTRRRPPARRAPPRRSASHGPTLSGSPHGARATIPRAIAPCDRFAPPAGGTVSNIVLLERRARSRS